MAGGSAGFVTELVDAPPFLANGLKTFFLFLDPKSPFGLLSATPLVSGLRLELFEATFLVAVTGAGLSFTSKVDTGTEL